VIIAIMVDLQLVRMKTFRRVVIIRSNPVGPDPRVQRVARALSEVGYKVTILGWDRMGELPVTEHSPYATINRFVIPAEFGQGIRNLPSLLRWEIALLKWLFQHRREYDIIHACDFDTILPSLIVRVLFGKKVVYDIFDFYAEMLRATPNIFKRLIWIVDVWAISHVDAVIVVDEFRRSQITGSKPRRLIIINNTPKDSLHEFRNSLIRRPFGSVLHLSFIGVLYIERGLVELLEVLNKHPEWSLDLAGFGGDEEVIMPRAKPLTNVRFHGRISYERAMELNWKADALIATYDPRIPNHRYASPNKLFEAMMLGKPIVVAEGTNMDRIVEEAGCGIVVPYGDVTELEGALSELARDESLRSRLGEAGRKAYDSRFNWNIMRRRLIDLYHTL
jgi:glycosyltransferase involved in cell wall biosynthesis